MKKNKKGITTTPISVLQYTLTVNQSTYKRTYLHSSMHEYEPNLIIQFQAII